MDLCFLFHSLKTREHISHIALLAGIALVQKFYYYAFVWNRLKTLLSVTEEASSASKARDYCKAQQPMKRWASQR
jgi:hypothetical protein